MADKTPIEWTDATWNPITGCSIVSPGCTNCYAMKLAGTRLKHIPSRKGLTVQSKAGPVWNGQVRFNEEFLLQPLSWKKPRMIFVCAHGDLFAEDVPDAWIDKVFAVMALAPQHTFQVLTKRPARMRDYVSEVVESGARFSKWASRGHEVARKAKQDASVPPRWPLPNVWLGVSAEDQKRADERIADLLMTPAAVRWLSIEPFLGDIDLTMLDSGELARWNCLIKGDSGDPFGRHHRSGKAIDWVVAGGESGPNARPMHPVWARSLRDQCADAGVPFFFKQWGNWTSVVDRDKDDPDWRADYSGRFSDRRPDIAWLNLEGGSGFHGEAFHVMQRVAKGKAGRILDGVTHDAFPKTERLS